MIVLPRSPDYSKHLKTIKAIRNIYWCACFETFCDKLFNRVLYCSLIPYRLSPEHAEELLFTNFHL